MVNGCRARLRSGGNRSIVKTLNGHSPFTVYHSLLEAVERLRLVLVYVEDGQELRDGEQVFDLGLQVEELELSLLARDGRVARHQLADAARIHVADAPEVEEYLLPALVGEVAHGRAQAHVALADGDLAFEVEDGHVPGLTLAYVEFCHWGKSACGIALSTQQSAFGLKLSGRSPLKIKPRPPPNDEAERLKAARRQLPHFFFVITTSVP